MLHIKCLDFFFKSVVCLIFRYCYLYHPTLIIAHLEKYLLVIRLLIFKQCNLFVASGQNFLSATCIKTNFSVLSPSQCWSPSTCMHQHTQDLSTKRLLPSNTIICTCKISNYMVYHSWKVAAHDIKINLFENIGTCCEADLNKNLYGIKLHHIERLHTKEQ